MSTIKPDKGIVAKNVEPDKDCCAVGIVISFIVLILASIIGFGLYLERNKSNEQLQAFKTHFAPLSEVQEMYNLSTLYADWPTFRGTEDISWSRIGSESPPKSLLELTTNLLLKSVEKQHALESEVETLKHLLGYVAYGFAFMFLLICTLFHSTSRSH